MPDEFPYDVFLSHSAKDKAVVRPLAERLRKDGVKVWFDEWVLKPGDSIPSKIEEGLERSRILVFCMSANAFGSDWAQLESGTFRFRDPLNKERRFVPLRLDDAPIKGSLAQFLYINWLSEARGEQYAKLLEASLRSESQAETGLSDEGDGRVIFAHHDLIRAVGVSIDGKWAVADAVRTRLTKIPLGSKSSLPKGLSSQRKVESSPLLRTIAICPDGVHALACSSSGIEIWNLAEMRIVGRLVGPERPTSVVDISADGCMVAAGSYDGTISIWDFETRELRFRKHVMRAPLKAVAISPSDKSVFFGGDDGGLGVWTGGDRFEYLGFHFGIMAIVVTPDGGSVIAAVDRGNAIQVWDIATRERIATLEGHTGRIFSLAVTNDGRTIASGGFDRAIRVWDLETGECLSRLKGHVKSIRSVRICPDDQSIISGSADGTVRVWPLVRDRVKIDEAFTYYTNAKVLLVGDTNAGKTGLTHRLATGEWKPSEDSTVGAWSTQWQLKDASVEHGVDREIWLWDFGGQADQRLIHQLYMDRTALILLLFNADQEDVLPGLRDWQTALRRCVREEIPYFLVGGRIDTGFKASRGKLQTFAEEHGLSYFETSAKSGVGCDELRAALIAGIPWDQMEKRTSPRVFKLIKDEFLKLRDEGQVLHTFKELRELLWRRLPDEPRLTDETLQTVIGLLDGPGVVKELDYGTYILLAPEWINAYAQAVIRTLRSAEKELGVLPLRSIAEGKLIYQSVGRDGVPAEMKRLQPAEERVVLSEMERQLEQRGLCLRQGDKLVFPSHCGRDRPAVLEHPSVFVSYAVKGFLDDIYATLVVKLADSESFQLKELWRDAADFVTLAGDHHMGLKLTRASGSDGDISVYFGKGVTQQEQVIFANYIHAHLQISCEQAQRLRHYVCPHCHTAKGNAEALMKKLLAKKQDADTECDGCSERFLLWDALEKKFASEAVRALVEQLQADDVVKLTERRKGKLLVLDVGARITSANQKWIEIPGDEDDGIDLLVEFTDDEGNGIGNKGLCLQLKAGNSHLTKRKSDGAEIFIIKKQRWVKTWMNQAHPVMLVIGTFSKNDDPAIGGDKLEFADVRWMEITSVLKRESANGTKPVKQIEFKGERMDLASVRKWRGKMLTQNAV